MGCVGGGQSVGAKEWGMAGGEKEGGGGGIGASVLRQADKGNIILLHDGGGDRSQTVAALPQMIDALRARGYQLVAVPDLIGKTRAEVMPALTSEERFEARADGFIFALVQWLRFGMATIFIAGIVLVSGRALIIGILALI